MAMKINAGDYTRQDLFLVDPKEILVVDTVNGRKYHHDDNDISKLMRSFEEPAGQIQPVQVRRIQDNKIQLVLGYKRTKAAMLFNELHPDKPMKLKCTLTVCNDEEALQRNITENKDRSKTSAVDDAHNQRTLREKYGWSEKRICDFYGHSQGYVSQLKKLLGLSEEFQYKVHTDEMSLQAALSLTEVSSEEQKEIVAESTVVTPKGRKVKTSKVRKAVRKKKIKRGKKEGRSLSEVREYFASLTGPAESEKVRTLADMVLSFIKGGVEDELMTAYLNGLLSDPVKVAA